MRTLLLLTLCLMPLASSALAEEVPKEDAQKAEQRELIRKMFLPVLQVELSQFKRVGRPSDEVLQQAIDQGQKALTEFADKHATDKQNGQIMLGNVRALVANGNVIQMGNGQNELSRDVLEVGIRQRLKPLLDDEQKKRYQAELDQLEDYKRDSVIDFIVNILDEQLNLTAEQHEKITKKLQETWKSNWEAQLQLLPNFEHYLPTLPAESVRPYLNDDQLHIFSDIRQLNFTAHMQINNQFIIKDIELEN